MNQYLICRICFVELVFCCVLFINAVLFVPQALQIYKNKSAKEQSLTTFAGFNIIQLVTMLHACIHHDIILFWGNLLAFLSCGVVTFLIIFYNYCNKR